MLVITLYYNCNGIIPHVVNREHQRLKGKLFSIIITFFKCYKFQYVNENICEQRTVNSRFTFGVVIRSPFKLTTIGMCYLKTSAFRIHWATSWFYLREIALKLWENFIHFPVRTNTWKKNWIFFAKMWLALRHSNSNNHNR